MVWITIKKFIGDKLSTQSLVLGKKESGDNISDLIIKEHHLIKKHQIYCLEKLNSRELYNMQLILNVERSTAQTYFEKNFENLELEWKDIYALPREQRLVQILVYFSTNYYIIFYILTKCSTNLVKRYLQFALVWKNLKAQFTFFILAQKQTFSGWRYNILSKMY